MKGSITTLAVGLLGVVLVMAPGCSHKSLKYKSGDHQWGKDELSPSTRSASEEEWALTFSQGAKSGPEGWKQDGGTPGSFGGSAERYHPGVIDPADPRYPEYAGKYGMDKGHPMINFGGTRSFSNGANDPFPYSSSEGLREIIVPGSVQLAKPSFHFEHEESGEGMSDGAVARKALRGGLQFYNSPHGAIAPGQGELGYLPEFGYGAFEEGDGRSGWGTHPGQFSQEYMGEEFPIASVPGSPRGGDQGMSHSFAGSGNQFSEDGSGRVIPSMGASHQRNGLTYQGIKGSNSLQDVFFEFDRWNITPEYFAALSLDKEWVLAHQPASLTIEGHSDSRGTQNYNLVLAQKRAKAVESYLIDLGVDPSILKIISYGEERPFCREATEQCYQLNRRGHLVTHN